MDLVTPFITQPNSDKLTVEDRRGKRFALVGPAVANDQAQSGTL